MNVRLFLYLLFLQFSQCAEAIEPPSGFFDIANRLDSNQLSDNERSILERISSAANHTEKDQVIGLFARKITTKVYDGITIIEYNVGKKTGYDFLVSIYENTRDVFANAGIPINQLKVDDFMGFQRMDINLPPINERSNVMSFLAKKYSKDKLILITAIGESFMTEETASVI